MTYTLSRPSHVDCRKKYFIKIVGRLSNIELEWLCIFETEKKGTPLNEMKCASGACKQEQII